MMCSNFACKLIQRVISLLKINVNISWCNFMIILSWIQKESVQRENFVANRVSTIQEINEGTQCQNVSSQENLAKLMSIGVNIEKIRLSELL